MSANEYIGWDIGGAHLKMAHIDARGQLLSAVQIPTPLWQGQRVLMDAISDAVRSLPKACLQHAFTTTAELADIFVDRSTGIKQLAGLLRHLLQNDDCYFYAGEQGWVSPDGVSGFVDRIASANWHATARYVAGQVKQGVLVDIGSTTTDIIPFADNRLYYSAYDDYQRLYQGELVYTGIIRTPVMAITNAITINTEKHPLIAEHFATMADVYRLNSELPEEDDMMDTADGAGKSVRDSARRLARMLGRDLDAKSGLEEWRHIARLLAAEQFRIINQSLVRVIAGCKLQAPGTLVGAGAGRFLVRKLADANGLDYIDFTDIVDTAESLRANAARSATAVAVAALSRNDAGKESRV